MDVYRSAVTCIWLDTSIFYRVYWVIAVWFYAIRIIWHIFMQYRDSSCGRWLWLRGRSLLKVIVDSSWNVMAHGDAREGKWRGNWRVEWVASTLHTTSKHGVSSITTADAHTSAASSRLKWRPRRFKRTRPFCRKTKYGFCACAVRFQTQSTKIAWLVTGITEIEFCFIG